MLTLVASFALALPAEAQDARTLTLGLGLGLVNTHDDTDNGAVAGGSTGIGSSARPMMTLGHDIRATWGARCWPPCPTSFT